VDLEKICPQQSWVCNVMVLILHFAPWQLRIMQREKMDVIDLENEIIDEKLFIFMPSNQ
jgi:hypothetical protein